MASCQLEMKGKLSGEVEVKSSSTAVFHLFVSRPHLFANICPSIVQSCHVEHGEFDKKGSLIVWNYSIDGKFCVAKDVLEKLDVVNKSATYRCVEGDLKSMYKTFLFNIDVKPQTGKCDLVQWTLEYEKVKEDVDDQTASMLNSLLKMTEQADAHFLSNPTQIE